MGLWITVGFPKPLRVKKAKRSLTFPTLELLSYDKSLLGKRGPQISVPDSKTRQGTVLRGTVIHTRSDINSYEETEHMKKNHAISIFKIKVKQNK